MFAMLVVDAVLAVGLLCSVILATCWGELCGIKPGGDKSGLGGFFAVYLLLPMRWLCVAIGLVHVLRRGAFPGVPEPDLAAWLAVLGAHTALGVLNVQLFGLGLRRVQNDRFAPDLFGWLGSTAVPLPAWLVAIVGTNGWLGNGTATLAVAAAGLVLVHALPYRSRRDDMLGKRRPAA